MRTALVAGLTAAMMGGVAPVAAAATTVGFYAPTTSEVEVISGPEANNVTTWDAATVDTVGLPGGPENRSGSSLMIVRDEWAPITTTDPRCGKASQRVTCLATWTWPYGSGFFVQLGAGNDRFRSPVGGELAPVCALCQAIVTVIGGEGDDTIRIDNQRDNDLAVCGEGYDRVYVDYRDGPIDQFDRDCESVTFVRVPGGEG